MTFTLIDIILIAIFLAFAMAGFAFGLIRSVGAIIGLALGSYLAGHFFQPIGSWLTPMIGGNAGIANVISFILIFSIVNRLTALAFHFINTGFNLIAIIPGMKLLNRLGGVILGGIEGLLTLGLFIYVVAKFLPSSQFVTVTLNNSQVAHYLVIWSKWIILLLPDAFSKIQSVF